jgi:hypothetical protein
MNNISSNDQEASPSNHLTDKSAFLEVWVDKEETLLYNCDWGPGEEGINAVSLILYKIILSDLGLQILNEIQEECVSNDSESTFHAIQNTIRRYSASEEKMLSGDDVVIPPDKIDL